MSIFREISPFCTLSLQGLRLSVKLGCGNEERQNPQFVKFNIRLRFASVPEGCQSDDLKDTVCYSEVSEKIREICQQNEYHLIEKLGWDVFSALKKMTPQSTQLWVQIIKEKPPIPSLEDGASFSVGDWAGI